MYTVNCKMNIDHTGQTCLDFYLNNKEEHIYLFSQRYKQALYNRFAKPITVEKALSLKSANSKCVRNVAERLRTYKNFVKKEFGIAMLSERKCRPYVRTRLSRYEFAA